MSDLTTLTARALRLSRRDAEAVTMALALPVMVMLLFVYLFGGAIHTGTEYVTYVVPGVLLLCVGFGAAGTATAVSRDLAGGLADRLRAMDVGALPPLAGQVVASLARNAVATVLVVLVAVAIGFRPQAGPVAWLAAGAVLGAWVLALSWLSAGFGVLTRSPDAAAGFSFFLSFLAYPSSAMVPVATMPSWLRPFADHQPVTHVVESLRGLLVGGPVAAHAAWAVGWSLALSAAAAALAVGLQRRRDR